MKKIFAILLGFCLSTQLFATDITWVNESDVPWTIESTNSFLA